jgi:hypothetical protein
LGEGGRRYCFAGATTVRRIGVGIEEEGDRRINVTYTGRGNLSQFVSRRFQLMGWVTGTLGGMRVESILFVTKLIVPVVQAELLFLFQLALSIQLVRGIISGDVRGARSEVSGCRGAWFEVQALDDFG